jgi:RimJ/RimL family protein N-acetyltransferase
MRSEYRTRRLLLRAWSPADAPYRKRAVDTALDTLRPWFPWAADDPRTVEAHAVLLAAYAGDFAAGRWWGYGIWRGHGSPGATAGDSTLIGALGVYRARHDAARPSVRELSYWLTPDAAGRGYATEAVQAAADAALGDPGVLHLEIRIDPANDASARVPPRLGFHLRERLTGDRTDRGGRPLDTLVWERHRTPAHLRPARPEDIPRLQCIRGAVGENRLLRPGAVTRADYEVVVERRLCWVWADAAGVQGFASGHPDGGPEVWAVFVHPAAEGRGAGSALLAQVTDALWALGHRRLTLATEPGTRAERMYRAAGWTAVGDTPQGDVRFVREL